jgi:hypothetical protein
MREYRNIIHYTQTFSNWAIASVDGNLPITGCGVGTEWQQQRVFNGKPKDALLKQLPHILSVGAVTADMWSW